MAAPTLVDTSAAIAYVVDDHDAHDLTYDALHDTTLGLAGHAAFETYSVLTRMPPPARRAPRTIARLLEASFPATRFLSAEATHQLHRHLASEGIHGGAVFDALVGAAAAEHGAILVTRDQRAVPTYRAVGAEIRLLA